jgi:hypothetical protein
MVRKLGQIARFAALANGAAMTGQEADMRAIVKILRRPARFPT